MQVLNTTSPLTGNRCVGTEELSFKDRAGFKHKAALEPNWVIDAPPPILLGGFLEALLVAVDDAAAGQRQQHAATDLGAQ